MNRVLLLLVIACGQMVSVSAVSAEEGRGTYTNPIAGGTIRMGDPFVILYEGAYYLYGTMRHFGGWRSQDFADWEYTGPAYHYAKPEYGIGYATASSPLGPWAKSPMNPLVVRRPEIGVSGPGHNSITSSPDGRELFMVYHTHADPNRPGADRTVNIDRLIVTPDGDLRLLGPTRRPQPVPSRN